MRARLSKSGLLLPEAEAHAERFPCEKDPLSPTAVLLIAQRARFDTFRGQLIAQRLDVTDLEIAARLLRILPIDGEADLNAVTCEKRCRVGLVDEMEPEDMGVVSDRRPDCPDG